MSSSSSDKGYHPTPSLEVQESYDSYSSTEREIDSKRKRTSIVWNDFKLVKWRGKRYAKCRYCADLLGADSANGTSHLKRHSKSCSKKQISEGKQRTLTFGVSESGATSLCLHKFDMENIRKLMAQCTIMHGLPFSLAEYEYHNMLLHACNSRFVPFSRRTLTREVMSQYKNEKMRYQGIINDVQRVSLTFDMWTSQQTLGYLCMTGQYIDKDWKLHAHILSFVHVPPPHDATSLVEVLSDCMSKWEIQSKLFSITADNCSTNDSVINSLKRNMGRRNLIPFRGQHCHIRCGAHILNLMVQDGLEDIDATIKKIRESVKYVRGSPKRMNTFKDCMKAMGLDDKKVLSYDVPTRWNSTYTMLRDALLYKDAFQHLASIDSRYVLLPSDEEWSHATSLFKFLKVFYNSTNIFSATRQVTANQVFEEVQFIYKHLRKHCMSANEHIRGIAHKMQEKFDKYFKDYNVLFAITFVLDPRSKLLYLKFLLDGLNEVDASLQYEKIKSSLYELYDEYKNIYGGTVTIAAARESTSLDVVETEEDRDYSRYVFNSYYLSSQSPPVVQNDLEKYLNDPLEENARNQEFNILSWWKSKEKQYTILAKMARDLLAIPVSTVASESAFSIAGRIVNDYRCSTTPENIEAIICTQSWIRDANNLCEIFHDGEEGSSDD